jgi:hydrogenase maturation factor
MCLTIPKQVISFNGRAAIVNSEKGQQEVGSLIKVKKNDWVLTQNNIIIQKIDKKQAEEIIDLFKKGGK